MATERRQFQYLADPVCIAALATYAAWRLVARPHGWTTPFLCDYLNDLLCLPLFVPIILRAERLLGIRRHDRMPRLWEILQAWIVFSVLFEVILPRYPLMFHTVGDPLDVVAYLVGGMVAGIIWGTIRIPRPYAKSSAITSASSMPSTLTTTESPAR